MPSYIRKLADPRLAIGASFVIAAAAVGYTLYALSHIPTGSYVHPIRGAVIQTVVTTGSVQAATSVDLSFQSGGSISYAGPLVGTHVSAGTTLGTLHAADLAAQLNQAKANLAMQQAKLAGLEAGGRPEDIALSQTAIASASSTLLQARAGVVAAANDAYEKSDDAIHGKVDQFVVNSRTQSPSLPFALSNSQLQQQIIADRVTIENILLEWQAYRRSIPADSSAVDTQALSNITAAYLQKTSAFLDEVATGLNAAVSNTAYPMSVIQGYQASVALARAQVSAAASALNNTEIVAKNDEAALAQAQSQLVLKQAPASATDIQAQQAMAASAQAAVDLVQAQIGKTVISAPFSGTVTMNNAKPGATATPGVPLISMNSDSRFQVQVFVSNIDVAKIKSQNVAAIKLDAYPHDSFAGHVVSVDPAATIQNGISAYKVTLQFDRNDPRILAGLSGSIEITTESKENALHVPSSAIITRGNGTFVITHTSTGDVLTPVGVGITSSDGTTEVTSGLSESDEVRAFGNQ